jgi:hypothetical protein
MKHFPESFLVHTIHCLQTSYSLSFSIKNVSIPRRNDAVFIANRCCCCLKQIQNETNENIPLIIIIAELMCVSQSFSHLMWRRYHVHELMCRCMPSYSPFFHINLIPSSSLDCNDMFLV